MENIQQGKESPESQELLNIFAKIRNEDRFKKFFVGDSPIFSSEWYDRSGYGQTFNFKKTTVFFNDGNEYTLRKNKPCIVIKRKLQQGLVRSEAVDVATPPPAYQECYSLQEFYDNLKLEEKERGEAFGKELESFI